jgi:uncharacterized protein (DUF3820 family)
MRTLPFGKHKGEPLDEVPKDYLIWIVDKLYSKELVKEVLEIINANEREEISDIDREFRNIVG